MCTSPCAMLAWGFWCSLATTRVRAPGVPHHCGRRPTFYVLFVAVAATAQFRLAAAGPREVPGPRSTETWLPCFNKLTNQVKRADRNSKTALQLMFFGDSITETWRGTDSCLPCKTENRTSCQGVPSVFERYFGRRWRAGVMGIAGDQSATLIWRLQNGQLPSKHAPKVAVLLIGTNDLGVTAREASSVRAKSRALAAAVPGVARRVQQAVQVIRRAHRRTQIILMALLPRGTGSEEPIPVVAMEESEFRWPSVYTSALESVNARLSNYASRDGRVHFLDCGPRLLTPDGSAIDDQLMPDALHPNAAGHEVLAQCLQPLVKRLMR